jgi:hypothetical protein
MVRRLSVLVLMAALAPLLSCSGGPPCRAQSDCAIGSYCVLEVSGSIVDGTCQRDCVVNADCGEADEITVSTCTNEGRCQTSPRPPRLRILDPENDSLLEEGVRRLRLTGEIETAADVATIQVSPVQRGSCLVGLPRAATVRNPEPGRRTVLPFIVNDIELDPGPQLLSVRAQVGTVFRALAHYLEIPCPGCAEIEVSRPLTRSSVPGLELPRLVGTIAPDTVRDAVWRVRDEHGGVFDGPVPVSGGAFEVRDLPLFAGANRVEVVVSGVGSGLGESRCTVLVTTGVAAERGLRAILTWDGPTSDLDLHVVGPGGRLGDPLSSLSGQTPSPSFGGAVRDDFDGLGPELATVEGLADGVYGVVVEPVYDDRDPGSTAILRVLVDGRPVVRGPIGPQFLSEADGRLWVAGTLSVVEGVATWRPLGDLLERDAPPTRPPADWPEYH